MAMALIARGFLKDEGAFGGVTGTTFFA